MEMDRRDFLKRTGQGAIAATTAGSLAGLSTVTSSACENPKKLGSYRMKFKHVGWQVGINYQTRPPQGIDFAYLKQLIDTSADSGMNFISLMMISYAYFCPEHDGYAWPVKNPKLQPLKDSKCLNANLHTEFVSKTLNYAKRKGFHCQLMINSMIWNPEKVAVNYPQATSQCYRDGRKPIDGWMFCPDSPGGRQLALDEVADLLGFYKDSPVDSFVFERISYHDGGACFCPYTKAKFKKDTGVDLGAEPPGFVWKGNSIHKYLKEYVGLIRQVRPGIEVWAHTQGRLGWGHAPHVLRDAGIETVSNHTLHSLTSKKTLYQRLDWLAPLSCVPHICVRDIPTHNYGTPIKTPEMIRECADWLEDYAGNCLTGAMFFNEVRTTERNKAAVYKIVKGWKKNAVI